MNKERLKFIDFAKIVAVIWVIIDHSEAGFLLSAINAAVLPIFWMASGYTTKENVSLKRKFKRLVVPYLKMSVVCLAFTLLYRPQYIDWNSLAGILYGRLIIYAPYQPGISHTIFNIYNASLWFLPSLFTAYCVLRGIFMLRSVVWQGAAVVLCLMIAGAMQYLPILLPWSADIAFYIASFMWVGHRLRRTSVLNGNIWVIIGSTVVFFCLDHFCGPVNYSVREMGNLYPLGFLTGMAGAVAFLSICSLIEKTRLCSAVVKFFKSTLYIYGLQLIFLTLGAHVCAFLGMGIYVTTAVQVTAAVIGGYAIYRFLSWKGLEFR